MSSRALISAAVLLLIGALAPERLLAQENLDAGKSPSQLFAGTCNACHRSPRGLLKTVSPSSLPSFLRQHYTTSPNMAGVLSSYLISNGATDTRSGEAAKGAKGSKEGAKQEARQRPETDTAAPATPDRGADAHKGTAKQRLSKRGKPEEPASTSTEPAKGESASREDASRSEAPKPAEEAQPQSAKIDQPAETSAIQPDPVPAVTPAAPAAEPAKPQAPPPPPATQAGVPSPGEASVSPAGTEMAVPLPPSAVSPQPAPATVAAPSQPPVPPAGPPAPPISQ
jgi:hypothetical protein